MGKNFTVSIYPGGGYFLTPIEVEASGEHEALTKAVSRCLNEGYAISGFKWTEKEMKEVIEYYKKEREEYEDDYDFVTQHLNYFLVEEENFFLRMDNVRIEKGWNLYENSIPLKVKVWELIQKEWENMEKETLMKYVLETLARLKENTTEPDFENECDIIYEKVNPKEEE